MWPSSSCPHCHHWRVFLVEESMSRDGKKYYRYKCHKCNKIFSMEDATYTSGTMPGTNFAGWMRGISIPGMIIKGV